MTTYIIAAIIWLISYLYEKSKKNKEKDSKKINVDKKKRKNSKKSKKKNSINKQVAIDEKVSMNYNRNIPKTKRVIVDREKEIYNESNLINKDEIVNDIIFSEILSKPKSRR